MLAYCLIIPFIYCITKAKLIQLLNTTKYHQADPTWHKVMDFRYQHWTFADQKTVKIKSYISSEPVLNSDRILLIHSNDTAVQIMKLPPEAHQLEADISSFPSSFSSFHSNRKRIWIHDQNRIIRAWKAWNSNQVWILRNDGQIIKSYSTKKHQRAIVFPAGEKIG